MSKETETTSKVAKRQLDSSDNEPEEEIPTKRQKKLSKKAIFNPKSLSDKRYVAMAATESCLVLRLIAESFQKYVGYANIEWDEEGLHMTSMDTANVSLTSLRLKASGFTEGYRCERPISLGINFESMYKLFGKRRKSALALLVPQNTEKLRFLFRDHGKAKLSDFTMNLLDIDSNILHIPPIDYKTVVRIPSKELEEIFKEFTNFGDNICFSGNDDLFVISAKGDDGKAEVVLQNGQDGVEIQSCVTSTIKYPTKYLEMFSKAMCIADVVELRLDADVEGGQAQPMCIVCQIPNDAGELIYYVAPRFELDED